MPRPVAARKSEGVWEIRRGHVRPKPHANKARRIEDLLYNNPYGYKIERVWFDGRVVFATEQGEVDVDPKKVKVAAGIPDRVCGQAHLEREARARRRAAARAGSVQHLRLGPRDEEVQPDLAVQLRHRSTGLRREHASLGARLPPQRLRDQEEHRLRELTGALRPAVAGREPTSRPGRRASRTLHPRSR